MTPQTTMDEVKATLGEPAETEEGGGEVTHIYGDWDLMITYSEQGKVNFISTSGPGGLAFLTAKIFRIRTSRCGR